MDKLPKITIEVETKYLDEAMEKAKQLNELMEKNIELQQTMNGSQCGAHGTQYEFNKLRIKKNDLYGVNISLDDLELRGVLEYDLKSSSPGLAELSVKLMVDIDGIGN